MPPTYTLRPIRPTTSRRKKLATAKAARTGPQQVTPEEIQRLSERLQTANPNLKQRIMDITIGPKSPLMRMLDIASRPLYGIAEGVRRTRTGGGFAAGFGAGITGKQKTTFSKVLKEGGMSPKAAAILGFGMDVALDPVSWVSLGAAGLGRTVLKKSLAEAVTNPTLVSKVAGSLLTRGSAIYPVSVQRTTATHAAEKMVAEFGDALLKPIKEGIGPPLSSMQKRVGQQLKLLPDDVKTVISKHLETEIPKYMRGGFGVAAPFRPMTRRAIIPGTVTSKVVAPVAEKLLKTPGFETGMRLITRNREMLAGGRGGYIAAGLETARRIGVDQNVGTYREGLRQIAKEHNLDTPEGTQQLLNVLRYRAAGETLPASRMTWVTPKGKSVRETIRIASNREAGTDKILESLDSLTQQLTDAGIKVESVGKYLPDMQVKGTAMAAVDPSQVKGLNDVAYQDFGIPEFIRNNDTVWDVLVKYHKAAHDKLAGHTFREQLIRRGVGVMSDLEPGPGMAFVTKETMLPSFRHSLDDKAKLWLPRPVVNELERNFKPGDIHKALNGYRSLLNSFKRHVTMPSPGFHARNLLGGYLNNFLGGVSMKRYVHFMSMHGNPDKVWKEYGGLTSRQILDEMDKVNLFPPGLLTRADIEDVFLPRSTKGKVWMKTGGVPAHLGEKVMKGSEATLRGSAFLEMYGRTGKAMQAREFAIVRHGDYGELTPSEEYIKLAMPFYKWFRFNAPYQLQTFVEIPGRQTMVQKFMKNMFEGDEGPDEREKMWMDEFGIKKGAFLAKGPFVPGFLKDKPTIVSPDMPVSDINTLLSPGDMVRQLLPAGSMGAITGQRQAPFGGEAEHKDILIPRDMFFVKTLEHVPGFSGFFSVSAGGETMVSTKLLDALTKTVPDPTSRYRSAFRQAFPSPTTPGLPPVSADSDRWSRVAGNIAGIRTQQITPTLQDVIMAGKKKRLEDLIPGLYRGGYGERFSEAGQ
jgi:hypothetical protein